MKRLVLIIFAVCQIGIANAQTTETAEFSSLTILNNEQAEMQDFTVSSNSRYIAVANEGKQIKIFDGVTGKYLRSLEGVHDKLEEIALSNDGTRIFSIDAKEVVIIDSRSGEILKKREFKQGLRGFDISYSNRMIAVGDKRGVVYVLDGESLDNKFEVQVEEQVSSVAFSQDEEILAIGTGIAFGLMVKPFPIVIVETNTGQISGGLPGAPGATTAMVFSPDGSRLYSGHKNNTKEIREWSLERYSLLKTFSMTINLISNTGYNSIHVNKDETLLFATTDDKGIEIFDINTGEVISKKGRGKLNLTRGLSYFNKKIYPLGEGNNFLIGGFNKNLLYIFSTAKRGVVGYFHPFESEWAVVSADGRMDGSLRAIQNLVWNNGTQKIPLENTFDINFTPKLWSDLTITSQEIEEFNISSFSEAIPSVEISKVNNSPATDGIKLNTKAVSIEVKVTSNMENLDELHLYHNSKLIGSSKDKSQVYNFETQLTTAFGENNFFYAVAKNKKGILSDKSKLTVKYTGSSNEEPVLHLVTLGINKYRNPKYNLNYALSDADSLKDYLETGSKSIFGEVKEYTLRNEQVSRERIMEIFDILQNTSKEQDLVLFYYAGHGVMSTDPLKKDFFIIPYDITQMYGRDDMLKEKGISASELKEISTKINAQKQVFILDACQSAGALESIAARGAAEEKAIAQLARSTGTYWITATGSEQFATEFEELGHGVFTYSIIEGLKGKADNGDQKITIKELSAYVEARVPELSEKYKGTPQFPSGFSFGNDFPIIIINKR